MKKSILITATLAALAMLASCQKEQFTENVAPVTGVTEFTATIEQPTKTVIAANGKVTWKAGDEITVTDAASASAVYVAGSDGASTTFTLKDGQTAVGTEPYTATYGDIDNQEYDAAGANCPLTAAQTSTTNFKFSSPYAVVKITAKSDGGEVIDSVGVSYGEKTYTLDCGEGVALTSEGIDFFVSVNPANSASLSVSFHTADKTATKERTSAVTLAAKDLLQVQFTFTEGDWKSPEADTPEPLKGVFTVSAGPDDTEGTDDDIKVRFSQGNLRYVVKTNKWSFYEHQYDFCHTKTYTGHHSDTVSLFTWGYNAEQSIIPDGKAIDNVSRTSGDLEQTEDWGSRIGDGNTWRTLTAAEWMFLLSNRNNTSTIANTSNARYVTATVNGIVGMILFPDSYEHPSGVTAPLKINKKTPLAFSDNIYDLTAWEAMESAGAVFLPAAGSRSASKITNSNDKDCFYWSSSAKDGSFAYRGMNFGTNNYVYIGTEAYTTRDGGYSVRLVTNVSAAPTPTEPSSDYVEIKALYNGTDSTSLKWYRQNLAVTGSGNNPWKGKNSSAVKVPGTDKDVIVGDYFQWAAYESYALPVNDLVNGKTDKGLLIYTSFTNQFCVDGGAEDKFVFKMTETNKEYYFNPSFPKEGYVCISPYYSGGYTKYISGSVNLDSSDDVARIILGDGWRMPTQAEFSAMKDATYWAWDGEDCGYYVFTPYVSTAAGQIGNIAGLDKSDALLFFPASGYGDSSDFSQAGAVGYYWSGTLSGADYAHCLYFYNNGVNLQYFSPRSYGHAIRPVSD